MVRKTNIEQIKPQIDLFKKKLSKMGYKDAYYILFGSWAKGKQGEWSDIDLCVVSNIFSDNYFEESTKLRILANEIDCNLEPVARKPEDLNDKYSTLSSEIKKWGIVV